MNSFIASHGDLAIEKIAGEESDYEKILAAVESVPFLSLKKLVVVYNLSANQQAVELLDQIAKKVDDRTELIIIESKPDKRSIYYKQLKKITELHEYGELDQNKLADWLVGEATKASAALSNSNAHFLIERSGNNQAALALELEKLVIFNKDISKENIELLITQTYQSTIFNLLDASFAGNPARALKIYDEQRLSKVEPQAIHAMLVWQMHLVALCELAGNKNPSTLASETGLNSYVISKSQQVARRIGREKITKFLSLLRDIDYSSKHQIFNYDEAMRFAIVSLASTD